MQLVPGCIIYGGPTYAGSLINIIINMKIFELLQTCIGAREQVYFLKVLDLHNMFLSIYVTNLFKINPCFSGFYMFMRISLWLTDWFFTLYFLIKVYFYLISRLWHDNLSQELILFLIIYVVKQGNKLALCQLLHFYFSRPHSK